MRTIIMAIAAAATWSATANAADIDLTKGRLMHDGNYAIQTIGATNNTGHDLVYLEVECGFFRHGQLIRSGFGNTENIAPGQKAYFDVQSRDAADADSTECRVEATR